MHNTGAKIKVLIFRLDPGILEVKDCSHYNGKTLDMNALSSIACNITASCSRVQAHQYS
jgi:hypothetical protein